MEAYADPDAALVSRGEATRSLAIAFRVAIDNVERFQTLRVLAKHRVLVVRVHLEFLEKQTLPPELITKNIWAQRFQDIRSYERYLAWNGVVIRKFFLHVSKTEQKRRFLERLDNPEKNWKFSSNDIKERAFWNDYMDAYEDMIRNTGTPAAPWYVVPADNKWFTRIVVGAAVIGALDGLDLHYPNVSKEKLREFSAAEQILLGGEKS